MSSAPELDSSVSSEPPAANALIATADSPARLKVNRLPALLQKVAFWSVILLIGVAALAAGLVLRRWAWDQTEDIRFTGDINNAFRQGNEAYRVGYLNRYDQQVVRESGGAFDLDYGPARLLIATTWANWVNHRLNITDPESDLAFRWRGNFYGEAREAKRQYELCRPLLCINLVGEFIAAIGMFMLVRRWTGRRRPLAIPVNITAGGVGILEYESSAVKRLRIRFRRWFLSIGQHKINTVPTRPVASAILGLIAALFFWFDPALISNAHCWPQWDSWVLPFFLWALVAASYDRWFIAGLLVAAGAMFKGQILMVSPLFILWPLFRGQVLAMLRWVIGVATGTAALTGVWLVRNGDHANMGAVAWAAGTAAAVVLLSFALRMKWVWYARLPVILVATALILWPFFDPQAFDAWLLFKAVCGVLMLAALVRFLPRKTLRYTGAAAVASVLLLCVPIFNGSMGWFDVGIAYGTHHYMNIGSGPNNNLPEILNREWDWSSPMSTVYTMEPGKWADRIGSILQSVDRRIDYRAGHYLDIPLKYVLVASYAIALVLSSLGAAIQSSRESPRFLVAVCAPWIVMFALLTQMHQRYLLWGAATSAAVVALGAGWAMLHLLVSAIAWSQEFQTLMNQDSRLGNNVVLRFVQGWHPGVGWALLLTGAIFVYVGLKPQRWQSVRAWFIADDPPKKPAALLLPDITTTEPHLSQSD